MQHKLLTLLLIVFGVVAVLGRSQIRFMNARFYSGLTVDITTDIYSTNQTSLAVSSRYSDSTEIIPVSDYLQLPTPFIPEDSYITFYAYNKDDMVIPVNVLANLTVQPLQFQSHTLVYVDQSDTSFSSSVTNVPAQLFIFEEIYPQPGSFLKIVNVAVASYPYGGFTVRVDRYGDVYVPYGSDSGFLAIDPGYLNVTSFLPATSKSVYFYLQNMTTTLYIRGDIGEAAEFGYSLVQHDSSEYWSFVPSTPVETPSATPVYTPVAPGSPVAQIKFVNTYGLGPYAFALFDHWPHTAINVTTAALDTGYQVVPEGSYSVSVSNYDFAGGFGAYLRGGQRYSVYYGNGISFNILEDNPATSYNYNQSYVRLVNTVPGSTLLQLYTPSYGWFNWYSSYGEVWYPQFLTGSIGYGELYITSGNQTEFQNFFFDAGMTTTIYLYGTQENVMVYFDQEPLPAPSAPVCVNGYVESNGVCNCYSGYATDNSSPYKCAISAPYYCFNNQTDALSNDYVPYIPYWSAQVYGNQLSFTVYSNIVANRRTLVELPNSQCSFINSPQYYQQYTGACQDRLDVNIPFTDCGFTKTSTSTEDVYKGTVHVKQIDRVTVGGTTYDRVIDTPMPISIRMPKTLAVQSYVQVFGPPSLAIDAAFVGQTVSTETQSGNLQYVSSVQYPLQIETVQLVDLPYGVDAWIEVVNVNCSGVGPCVQRLEIHLNTSSCSISGVYRMVVSLSCRTDQGCPDEAKNGTQVYIESRIVSQSLCGEMSVDIDLNGYIQAFTDQDFTNPALAFYPGQSAYFLISAYSSRVSLSKVSIESVYYYGPNINYQYLSYNTSLSSIAVANNFTTGTQGNSQAWFGLDVSVSTPNSGDNSTLFKLYQGQNGVYNFVAIVDVEWYVANNAPTVAPYYPYQPTSTVTPTATPTATPPGPPIPAQPVAYAPTSMPTSTAAPVGQSTPSSAPIPPPTPVAYPPTNPPLAKKRMVLQGSVSNQGSQFTAQVQVAGPTPSSQQPQQQQPQQQTPVTANPGTTDNKPVSSGVSLSSSLFVIAVALVALF